MDLQETLDKITELYVFIYENDIDSLSGEDKELVESCIRKCGDIVDDYEYLLE